MKFIANPVEVSAYKILQIEKQEGPENTTGLDSYNLVIGDGESDNQKAVATSEMCIRMKPSVGDYWVIQSDGYVYLNPKDVFERKYHAA